MVSVKPVIMKHVKLHVIFPAAVQTCITACKAKQENRSSVCSMAVSLKILQVTRILGSSHISHPFTIYG